ncbi:COG4315 family predicted lipoprotein [Onishia niordana]|uniref:COG4315 family predicted lipoprotein n=1 Tax=Onishia niordana TaxID=2508711 RepID=UPI00144867AD|nr:hypothetical protein [Halomonas niordiana]
MIVTLLLAAASTTLQAASETQVDDTVPGQSASEATKDLESVSQPVEQARLETRQQADYGTYLTNREGMSLYLFAMDEPGSASHCDHSCAIAWPPFTSRKAPKAGDSLDAEQLSTIEREDGTRQVTYAGWPLYFFSGDKEAGDALGQDVTHLGAAWYLVSPAGEKIEQGERHSAPSAAETDSND